MSQTDPALLELVDALRARGVRRYRAPDGLELEFGPVPAEKAVKGPTEEQLREAAQRRELEQEWAHVGGPPPWIADPRGWRKHEVKDGDEGAD